MAIIGGSGSGKTTLLNAMAARLSSSSSSLTQAGTVLYNGNPSISAVSHAFVLQQDILQPTLTCRETLVYAADLRSPPSVSKEHRHTLVENTIRELGLVECADTIVGDTSHRGLSGGEKRRLSIGIQLLANPSLLFLDEPTTGLDANSAYLLVRTCKNLALAGRTVIMSIHQPRADIFFLFDSVSVLTKGGRLTYSGSVADIIPHFESQGHTLPLHVNPADFIIDICAIDSRTSDAEAESVDRVNRLVDSWSQRMQTKDIHPKLESDTTAGTPEVAPIYRQIAVLTKRQFVMSYRDPMGYAGLLFECIAMGIICGWIFYQMDGSTRGIRSQLGAFYTSVSLQGYLLLIYEIYRLCRVDMKVFDREHSEHCVSVFGFLVSRRLSKCLTEDLFVPLIFSVITYFMMGFTRTANQFFIYFAIGLLNHYGAIFFATLSAGISRDFAIASVIGNLFYTIQFMACGFFANVEQLPVYVRWTHWVAYLYYSLTAVINNQFQNFFGDCPYGNDPSLPECISYTGSFIIQSMGFRENWIAVPIAIVTAWVITFYIIAGVILHFFPVRMTMAQQKTSKTSPTQISAPESLEAPTYTDQLHATVIVSVADLRLSIKKPQIPKFWQSRQIDILNGVTANFVPGKVNAILGPSGSGKSSLLNHIAKRLTSSVFTKYTSTESIFFNGSLDHAACSFVTQEDDGLLPALTVRETLHYAAYLRLPARLSRKEKREIADSIILRMGLKYCADTPIGDEHVKGISGGEKRRVSISIQLLNDPQVLLLDEPTSGLDSFTAASILDVLSSLAKEGRTIVCSIHQPRSDMFPRFGNIVLLAKGGRTAYNGTPDELFPYLEKIGYPCPQLTNPADHLLDLVSINFQSTELESSSRERMKKMLEEWSKEEAASEKGAVEHCAAISDQPPQYNNTTRLTIGVLVERSFTNIMRSPHLVVARITQVSGVAAIMALYFSPLHNNFAGISNRLGLLQQVTAVYFVGMLNNIAVYPLERSVFYREYDDEVYGVTPFFLSYTLVELPFEVITAMTFSALYAMATDLQRSAGMFFLCTYCVLVIVNCAESIGIAFNTIFEHEGFAINVISVVLSIATMMSGLMSLDMPPVLRAINWVSPLKYSVSLLSGQAFPESLQFSCEGQVIDSSTGKCALMNGRQVLETYGLEMSSKKTRIFLGVLAVALVLYRLLAYAILKANRLKLGIHKYL